MKSDTITTSDRRLIVRTAPASSSDEVGRRGRGQHRLRREVLQQPEDGQAAGGHRDVPAGARAVDDGPTRLPRRVRIRASVPTKSIRTVRLSRLSPTVPKSTDGLRSSRNQAVISRSSWYSRTYGIVVRAVTFQSR